VYADKFPSNDRADHKPLPVPGAAGSAKSVIQIDVLNGCGVSGTGQKMTSFLVPRIDVVDMVITKPSM